MALLHSLEKPRYKTLSTATADQVNCWFNKSLNYDSPYKLGTKVNVYRLTKFVRVYDGFNSLMKGSWLMNASDVKGLTAAEIQNKYSLSFTPRFICDVQLKKGDLVRSEIAKPLYGFTGGSIQFDIYRKWGQVIFL